MEDRYPDRRVLAIASSFDTSVNKLIRALILSFNSLSLFLYLYLFSLHSLVTIVVVAHYI